MMLCKFRGVGIDKKEFVYGYGVIALELDAWIIHKQGINSMQHTAVHPLSVGFFCGKIDVRGRDIYQGDIVRVGGCMYLVGYNQDKGRWTYVMPSSKTFDYMRLYDHYEREFGDERFEVEIIGNIYFNSDLIA